MDGRSMGDVFGSRVVVLDGEVDDALANEVVARLLRLSGTEADILLYIDSPGGSVSAGMAIYDTMQYIPCDVVTRTVGLAAGMGQLLLSAGAPGKRWAAWDARIVMTEPQEEGDGPWNEEEGVWQRRKVHRTRRSISELAARYTGRAPGRGESRNARRTRQLVSELMARHTGRDPERIRADWTPACAFSAEEARAYGLIDHVSGLHSGEARSPEAQPS